MPRFAASLAMLFTEVPLPDRFALAAQAGFHGVEVQWPYEIPKEAIAERLQTYGLVPALFNVAPMAAAIPGKEEEFRAGFKRALEYAEAAGRPLLHCMAGIAAGAQAEAVFVANLRWAAREAAPLGIRLLIEPVNDADNPGYFLTRSSQALRILDQVGSADVLLQYDFYHMQIMEGNLAATVAAQIDRIGHFQVGGVPGRNEPDATQEINYPYLFDRLDDLGYRGWVGCEYRPRRGTVEGLGWARQFGIASRS
jgi:hydroxypyruvate isomerase